MVAFVIIRIMKVASNKTYGDSSVIKIVDLPLPTISDDQILIKVHFSSVNRTDEGFLHASPFVTRFFTGLFKPKYLSLGCEFSGVVTEVGDDVKYFKIGDMVFGFDDTDFGGYAEYKAIAQEKAVAKVPVGVSLKQAAVALEGAHYALFYLYALPKTKNLKIFVNGATGAIGSAAVQILKAEGYYVEASSTTEQIDNIKQLGVDKVIDWQQENISVEASKCDVYFDAVGKSSYKEARKILKSGGMYMSSELGKFGQNPLLALINPIQKLFTKNNVKFPVPKTRKKEATVIAEYLASGDFTPLIDREYKIEDVQAAFDYVETGKKVGNVLIKIN